MSELRRMLVFIGLWVMFQSGEKIRYERVYDFDADEKMICVWYWHGKDIRWNVLNTDDVKGWWWDEKKRGLDGGGER